MDLKIAEIASLSSNDEGGGGDEDEIDEEEHDQIYSEYQSFLQYSPPGSTSRLSIYNKVDNKMDQKMSNRRHSNRFQTKSPETKLSPTKYHCSITYNGNARLANDSVDNSDDENKCKFSSASTKWWIRDSDSNQDVNSNNNTKDKETLTQITTTTIRSSSTKPRILKKMYKRNSNNNNSNESDRRRVKSMIDDNYTSLKPNLHHRRFNQKQYDDPIYRLNKARSQIIDFDSKNDYYLNGLFKVYSFILFQESY
jgi:hypothetical protein